MQIPAAVGEKLSLSEVKNFPDGDFLISGNAYTSSGFPEGIMIRTDNFGSIKNQERLRISNQPIVLSNAIVLLNGQVLINGMIKDGTNGFFVGLLKNDFSIAWMKLFSMSSPPRKLVLDCYDTTSVAFAVQLSSSVVYATLSKSSNLN